MVKDDAIFLPIWEFKVSPGVKIVISRMVFPQKEKDFFNNEEYLKQVQTKKDYEIESKRRIKYKQDNEKFYINSVKSSISSQYRTKGLSIFRQQLPKFIEALENIQQGVFDPFKQNNKKLYINSVTEGFEQSPYPTHGISIFRQQLPKFIEALENIQQGVFDPWINKMLLDTGAVKKIPQELVDSETNNMETRKKNQEYKLWFQTLTNTQKKEVKKLEKSGWSTNEIIDAFKAKFG